MTLVQTMCKDCPSNIFGKEKDNSFKSSIAQIYQSFAGQDLYPSLEERYWVSTIKEK